MNVAIDITCLNWKYTGVQRYTCELISNLDMQKELKSLKIFWYKQVYGQDYRYLKENLKYVKISDGNRIAGIVDPIIASSAKMGGRKRILRYFPYGSLIHYGVCLHNNFLMRGITPLLDQLFYKRMFTKIDVLHLPFPVSNHVLGRLSNIFYKKPKIATVYDLSSFLFEDFLEGNVAYGFRKIIEETVKTVDKIIAISQATKRDLVNILNVPENRIEVIYPGVGDHFKLIDGNRCAQKVREFGLDYKSYLLCLFTIEPRKNLGLVLQAYNKLSNCWKNCPRLIVVGEKGWRLDRALGQYREYLDNPNILFKGFVEESLLPYVINGALLLVYPSFYEGFGLPVVEAMKCGIPVICSNTSSFPEIVGGAAIMVDPSDVDGLTRVMLEIIKNGDLRKELSRKGLARAKRFDWREATRQIVEVYKKMI